MESNFKRIFEDKISMFKRYEHYCAIHPGGGVLPYMGYIGTCRGIGYGF